MSINVVNRIYLGQIGRVPVIEQHEKLSYLNEHISYEVIMLNYTFMRLVTLRPATSEEELDRNAFLDSFGIHARNLIDFSPSERGRMTEPRPITCRTLRHPIKIA
jgi:hypothetical protein